MTEKGKFKMLKKIPNGISHGKTKGNNTIELLTIPENEPIDVLLGSQKKQSENRRASDKNV